FTIIIIIFVILTELLGRAGLCFRMPSWSKAARRSARASSAPYGYPTAVHFPARVVCRVVSRVSCVPCCRPMVIGGQGTVIYGGGGPLHCEIDSIEDARTALRRLKAYGAFSAKSYNQPCRAARQQLLQVPPSRQTQTQTQT